jgi:hypothetical protein
MKWLVLSFTVLLCMFPVACTKPDVPTADCSDILPAELSTVPFTDIEFNTLVAQIKGNPQAKISDVNNERQQIVWSIDSQYYRVYLNPPAHYFTAVYPSTGATISQVLDCFGPPDYYEARLFEFLGERRNERLTLWYLSKGIVFEVRNYGTFVSGEFSENSVVNSAITLTPPGTIDEMAVYVTGESAKVLFPSFLQWPSTFSSDHLRIRAVPVPM